MKTKCCECDVFSYRSPFRTHPFLVCRICLRPVTPLGYRDTEDEYSRYWPSNDMERAFDIIRNIQDFESQVCQMKTTEHIRRLTQQSAFITGTVWEGKKDQDSETYVAQLYPLKGNVSVS